MKKTLIILGLGIFLFSCNETAESTENETTGNKGVDSKTEKNSEVKEEEKSETKKEESVEMVSLEDRNYKVEEFVEMFNENKDGLKEQNITIEGYYMNYNKQKAANTDDEFEYNVTLYKDDSFDRDSPQAFFKMKSKDGDQFKGIKQKDQITVSGKITGDEFFGAPMLEEGVVVKK
jgi:DNA polymerase III alpha subunit (gram-positive type)